VSDRDRILDYLNRADLDGSRAFGRPLLELAEALGIQLERAEFLVLDMERKGEISVSGSDDPRNFLVTA